MYQSTLDDHSDRLLRYLYIKRITPVYEQQKIREECDYHISKLWKSLAEFNLWC